MARGRTRWLAFAIALALIAALAAAAQLSRTRPTRVALSTVRGAPDASRDAGTFAIELDLTLVPADAKAERRTTRATGVVDSKSHRAFFDLFPVLAPEPLQLVSDKSTAYVSIPRSRQPQLGNKRWVRVKASTEAAAQGAGIGPLPDPITMLDALHAADTPVRQRGKRVTASIVLARADDLADEQQRVLASFGRLSFPVDATVDADGRLQQAVYTIRFRTGETLRAVLRLGDFGTPLRFGIPPKDAVVDAPTLDEALRLVTQ